MKAAGVSKMRPLRPGTSGIRLPANLQINHKNSRGQASFKISESPQDFQLLNPHSPNQDIVVIALIIKNL